ncbi:MAG TPA: hypothetical protein VNL98_11015 [Gemmatimonadales bacterium]|nr:hypothetical protein [Gemmatimonadales bacterium]
MPLSSRTTAALLLMCAVPLAAQQRRSLASDDPQAQVMGYFAAVMQLTPSGQVPMANAVGGELTWIPELSDAERRVGFGGTKDENTNLCPVLPRLRGTIVRGVGAVEVGYVPPLEVCGVKANLLGVAISRRIALNRDFAILARVSALLGRLEAAITCGPEAVNDTLDLTCFGGQVSNDRLSPASFALEAGIYHGHHRQPRLDMYALAGVRRERLQFDVNYTRTGFGSFPGLDDHERFTTSLTRVHALAGAGYRLGGRLRVGAELYWAPGAVFTLRSSATIALGAVP